MGRDAHVTETEDVTAQRPALGLIPDAMLDRSLGMTREAGEARPQKGDRGVTAGQFLS